MISLSDWKTSGKYMSYHGYQIFWRAAGPAEAPVLLLIHGFPTASWDWEALWRPLTERFRVLTLDMIGFGFSDKPTDYRYTIADQANLFEAFLAEQGVRRYHVLAHDYGDTVAQELLARQQEAGARPRIDSVCLLNGGLFPETHRALLMQKLMLTPMGPLLAKFTSRGRIAAAMRGIFGPQTQPDAATLDNFWALLSYNNGTAVMPALMRYITERRENRERWVGALQNARVPLKVIDGAVDPISGAHMVERYRELIHDADVTLLEDIGHYPQVEAPEQVLSAYEDFFTRIRP